MENFYDDALLPESFEEMAKAYSANLKEKGFVFIKLHEEEKALLLGEILVLIAKMKACLKKLNKKIDGNILFETLGKHEKLLCEKYTKKPHNFVCVENENKAFLSLVSAENMLIFKLLSFSIKSDENEFCFEMISQLSSVMAESFSLEGFALA